MYSATHLFGRECVVGELLDTRDLTARLQRGWAFDYRIRRDDGEELHAEVRCWDKARESAERAGNTEALDAIADRRVAAPLVGTGRLLFARNVMSRNTT
jgi:hypothetical protein